MVAAPPSIACSTRIFLDLAWVDVISIRGCPAFGCGASTGEAVGGTLRLGLHLGLDRGDRGRKGVEVGIVTDLGATVAEDSGASFGPGVAWGVYVVLGYGYY